MQAKQAKLCTCCSAVLFPLVVTVYVTWWFLTFFDNFFSVRWWQTICQWWGYSTLHARHVIKDSQWIQQGIHWCCCSQFMKLFLGSMSLDLALWPPWLLSFAQVMLTSIFTLHNNTLLMLEHSITNIAGLELWSLPWCMHAQEDTSCQPTCS